MFDQSMKKSYETDGFLVVENLFSDTDLRQIRQRTDEIVADPDSAPKGVGVGREGDTAADRSSEEAANRAVRGTSFMVRFDPLFQRLALQPKLLEIVRGLLGPKVRVFRDQMLLKPPGGQAKPLHQDQSYFRVLPEGELVTAWIALDEVTTENGCMCYVPASHTHGIFEIATDPPGFAADEPAETMGSALMLPPRYERLRAEIEDTLPPLTVPARADA